MLAHNGEINTLKGNINWMKSHEIKMASALFGDDADDIKPIIQAGRVRHRRARRRVRVLVRAGREAPIAKLMLVPEAWSKKASRMPQAHRAMYAYLNAVMEPWDGPAALAMTDGRWVVAGMDRNGLRPLRYTITDDGLLIVGSETGMVALADRPSSQGPARARPDDRGRSRRGRSTTTARSRTGSPASIPMANGSAEFIDLDRSAGRGRSRAPFVRRAELRRRQVAAGQTLEDMELILHPMVEDAKEAVGSMGDDTPLAVLSDYPPLSAISSARISARSPTRRSIRCAKTRVMSLKTRFGNLGNILAQDEAQTDVLVLEIAGADHRHADARLKAHFGGQASPRSTAPSRSAAEARRCAPPSQRIRQEAEDAVRQGCGQLFLTDEPSGLTARRSR